MVDVVPDKIIEAPTMIGTMKRPSTAPVTIRSEDLHLLAAEYAPAIPILPFVRPACRVSMA